MTNETTENAIAAENLVVADVCAPSEPAETTALSTADVKHNMKVLIMLETIFALGATDMQLALAPLWKYLGATNALIGLVGSMTMLSLVGNFFSPFISVRFRVKKWYLLVSHLPYLGALGFIGVSLLLARGLGLSVPTMLGVVVVSLGCHYFFAGFVSLPHNEYIAACIPMSHRGRFSGYSSSIGAAASMASSLIGGLILLRVGRPASFGCLMLMTWLICQGGYLLALWGRERPTPVERAPKPWTKQMLLAAWRDWPFLRVVLLYMAYLALFMPTLMTYLTQYALRDVGMVDASVAVMAIVMQITRLALAGPIGHLVDRFSPKRAIPWVAVVGCLSLVPVLVMRNSAGVYVAMALTSIFGVTLFASFNALVFGLPSPENRSGHYSVQILSSNVAMAVGPLVIGRMCDSLKYRPTFAIVAVLALALAAASHHLLRPLSAESRDYS